LVRVEPTQAYTWVTKLIFVDDQFLAGVAGLHSLTWQKLYAIILNAIQFLEPMDIIKHGTQEERSLLKDKLCVL